MLFTYVNSKSFAPPDIPNLALWLDASDSGTITQVAGSVSQWNDKSGNGRNAVQATGANQPRIDTRTINGKPAMEFNGSTTAMTIPSFPISQPNRYFIVVSTDSLATGTDHYITDGGAGGTGRQALAVRSGALGMFAGTDFVNGGVVAINQPMIVLVCYQGGSSTIRINGGAPVATGNPGTNGLTNFCLGARLGGGLGHLDGLMGEIIGYNGGISQSSDNQIGQYLAAEWNIPWTNI